MSSAPSPPAALTIRQAAPGDAAAIEVLYRQLVSNPAVQVQDQRIAQLASNPAARLLVAEQSGQVVATALVAICPDVMFGDAPFAVVENIVVDSQRRAHGIGTTLLAAIEAFCAAQACSKIMLLSARQREDAHRFFERSGFQGDSKRGFVKYRRQFRSPDVRQPDNPQND